MRPGAYGIESPFPHPEYIAFGSGFAVVAAVFYRVVVPIERVCSAFFARFFISVARMPSRENKFLVLRLKVELPVV